MNKITIIDYATSAQATAWVRYIGGDKSLVVEVRLNGNLIAPAYYERGRGRVVLSAHALGYPAGGEEQKTLTGDVFLSARGRESHPVLAGALVHEVGHNRHTRFDKEKIPPALRAVVSCFEEARIEKFLLKFRVGIGLELGDTGYAWPYVQNNRTALTDLRCNGHDESH